MSVILFQIGYLVDDIPWPWASSLESWTELQLCSVEFWYFENYHKNYIKE
jgi:hypothetical protein